MKRSVLPVLLVLAAPAALHAATFYVAPAGDDTAVGSEGAPFATWERGQSAASPGDTVYFRGGRYKFKDATSTCSSTSATVNAVVLSKSGTSDKPIRYWAYPGERPIFDFSGITDTGKYNCRQAGVRVTGSWLHLKGLELTGALQLNNLNHESWCVYVYGGSNNVFEQLDAHHNMGPGFFVQRGGNNLFLNCDSHENEDTLTSNGDGQSADGFGCHPNQTGDTGNVFRGCRAWWNTDDGWDFINASAVCTVENSWTWYNGYKPDAINNGAPVSLSSGNGNGFKGGGYGMPPSGVPSPTPQHVIRFNVSFYNKAAGFYANHSPNNAYFYNNTGFHNAPDFNLLGVASDGSTSISVGILRNNLAFAGSLTSNADLGGLIDDRSNSWDKSLGLTITEADFQSVAFAPPASCPAAYSAGGTVCVPPTDTTSFAGMAGARQADGSLPVLPFLRPSAGSHVIDKGENIGFAFVGAAPDLGAFEYGASTGTGGSVGSGGQSGAGGATDGGVKADGGPAAAGGTAAGGRQGGGGAMAGSGGAGGTSNGGGGNLGSGGTRSDAGPGGAGSLGGSGGLANTGGATQGGGAATGGTTTSGGAGGVATGHGDGGSGGHSASGGGTGTGTTEASKSGCSCGVAGKPAGLLGPMALLLVTLLLRRRRSRA
jgi:MYXO-CTERM domain-containing protein